MKKLILFFNILFFTGISNSFSQKTLTITRDSFSVKYPDTWTIDKADEDYDPDALFSLDSPKDGGSIMFMIFSLPIDPDEMLNAQAKEMTKGLIKKPTAIKNFSIWGSYSGKGKIIEGKIMGLFKGHIKLFIYTDANKSMLVME